MAENVSKKVLIIAYYWPPAGGPGVQRWLKFVKYLPNNNIQPIVYVPNNPNYPILDTTLLDEIPNNIIIIKRPINEPYKFAGFLSKSRSETISKGIIQSKRQSFIEKLLLYIRGNFFIPDARKSWIKPSVDYLEKYIWENKIRTIITTGPPHSMHLIGLNLKNKLDIKWIADFRDPWTSIGYHKKLKLSRSSRLKHLTLESAVLNNADQLIVTSFATLNEFKRKTTTPIEVITNGFDYHDVERPPKDNKFTIAHIGTLLSDRNPEILWEVLSQLIKENATFCEKFRLKLIGLVSPDVKEALTKYKLADHTYFMGYIPHKAAIKEQMSSRVLLLIEIDSKDTRAIIPGKLFEYLHSETPIIALGPKHSDIERIIEDTKNGVYFCTSKIDPEILKQQILMYFNNFKKGISATENMNIEKYSRENLTKQLAKHI